MAYLFRLGYLLLVAPDTKKSLEKTGLFGEKMDIGKQIHNKWVGERGISIQIVN